MSEEQTQTTEGAAQAASSQEASNTNLEVTPAQTTNESQAENKETPEQEKSWEYDGNRKSVPKEFQKYAVGFDRYWTKKSQTLAEMSQKAREYEEFKNSEDFKSFEQYRKSNKPESVSHESSGLVTQDEIDAIALGDAKTLESVIDRAVNKRLEAKVGPIAMKQRELDAAETVKSFSELHPDFRELLDSPAGEFMLDAARRGADLESIYNKAKAAEEYFSQKAGNERKAVIDKKRNGSVVGKSIAGTPEIVFAENENQAKRLAIEMTLKGDKRQVQVKRK